MQEESKLSQGRGDEQPSWSQNFLSEGHGDRQADPTLQRKSQQEANAALNLDFAEPELQMFDYISQVLHRCLACGLFSVSFTHQYINDLPEFRLPRKVQPAP